MEWRKLKQAIHARRDPESRRNRRGPVRRCEWNGPERRQEKRIEPVARLLCALGPLVNLSTGGMCVTCTNRPPVAIGHELEFTIHCGKRQLCLSSWIIWMRRSEKGHFEFGTKFSDIDRKVVVQLMTWAIYSEATGAEVASAEFDVPLMNPYTTLGVARDVSAGAIRNAYRKLARKYHPDSSREHDAGRHFMAIQEAYEVLKDSARRYAYDRSMDHSIPWSEIEPVYDDDQSDVDSGRLPVAGPTPVTPLVPAAVAEWKMDGNGRDRNVAWDDGRWVRPRSVIAEDHKIAIVHEPVWFVGSTPETNASVQDSECHALATPVLCDHDLAGFDDDRMPIEDVAQVPGKVAATSVATSVHDSSYGDEPIYAVAWGPDLADSLDAFAMKPMDRTAEIPVRLDNPSPTFVSSVESRNPVADRRLAFMDPGRVDPCPVVVGDSADGSAAAACASVPEPMVCHDAAKSGRSRAALLGFTYLAFADAVLDKPSAQVAEESVYVAPLGPEDLATEKSESATTKSLRAVVDREYRELDSERSAAFAGPPPELSDSTVAAPGGRTAVQMPITADRPIPVVAGKISMALDVPVRFAESSIDQATSADQTPLGNARCATVIDVVASCGDRGIMAIEDPGFVDSVDTASRRAIADANRTVPSPLPLQRPQTPQLCSGDRDPMTGRTLGDPIVDNIQFIFGRLDRDEAFERVDSALPIEQADAAAAQTDEVAAPIQPGRIRRILRFLFHPSALFGYKS